MAVSAWFNKCPECYSRQIQAISRVEAGDFALYDYSIYCCFECGAEFDEHSYVADETTPDYYVVVYAVGVLTEPYGVSLIGASLPIAMEFGSKLLTSYPESVVMLVWAPAGANPGLGILNG